MQNLGVFAACFLAVAVAFFLESVLVHVTSAVIAWLILVLLGVVLLVLVRGGLDLPRIETRRRRD